MRGAARIEPEMNSADALGLFGQPERAGGTLLLRFVGWGKMNLQFLICREEGDSVTSVPTARG